MGLPENEWLEKTIELAEFASREERIAACKHIDMTERWLRMVIKGEIAEPSVVRIENLYKYFSDSA